MRMLTATPGEERPSFVPQRWRACRATPLAVRVEPWGRTYRTSGAACPLRRLWKRWCGPNGKCGRSMWQSASR